MNNIFSDDGVTVLLPDSKFDGASVTLEVSRLLMLSGMPILKTLPRPGRDFKIKRKSKFFKHAIDNRKA